MPSEIITIGIDSSTRKNGIAIFGNEKLLETFSHEFEGTFDEDKLKEIARWYDNFFEDYDPQIIIIEETVPMQNSKAVTALNKVWGVIFAVALNHTEHVYAMHNKTAKRLVGATTKQGAVELMKEKYPRLLRNASDDECDAVLITESYMMLGEVGKHAN